MLREKSLAVYKNYPALITAIGDKIDIALPGGETQRVREKDIELLHPGPAVSLEKIAEPLAGDVRGAWELLSESDTTPVPLQELAELVYGDFTPQSAWSAYGLLKEGLYFAGTVAAISARPAAAVEAEERKRKEKLRDTRKREAFLERAKAGKLNLTEDGGPSGNGLADNGPSASGLSDRRFLQDVEALAFGKTEKSRTLKELGRSETPEEAHRFLLAAGVWTPWVNPHPARFGLSSVSARERPAPLPEEKRTDLTGLRAYAIDNAYSADPDDAVSIEAPSTAGPQTLYVHVADPAAAILPNTPADLEARGRGATLYLPEGPARMLAEETLPLFALGLSDTSPALTFKLTLAEDGSITAADIFPSLVSVTRLTYEEADKIVSGEEAGADDAIRQDLRALFRLAQTNVARRIEAGAVMIDLPEVHITVDLPKADDKAPVPSGRPPISIESNLPSPAADMVRECMLLAGEGAARWALQRRLPFPYVCQETGELPNEPLSGMAGSYQLRRCMRPRTLSAKPGLHWGLGLDEYTQVTSPLRRYTDLLAHQQIRASLAAGAYRDRPPLTEDEVLLALVAGEAATLATVRAERASRAHWTAVYLADKLDAEWEGIVMEKKGNRSVVLIPALGLETQVPIKDGGEPNQPVRLKLNAVKIPEGEALFSQREAL
ncbi:exoribonuclease II [Spirochaetia bacterium]|nr:exoribonuclease II [Spirochaetia bacterium]